VTEAATVGGTPSGTRKRGPDQQFTGAGVKSALLGQIFGEDLTHEKKIRGSRQVPQDGER